jgi:hypothetical protein
LPPAGRLFESARSPPVNAYTHQRRSSGVCICQIRTLTASVPEILAAQEGHEPVRSSTSLRVVASGPPAVHGGAGDHARVSTLFPPPPRTGGTGQEHDGPAAMDGLQQRGCFAHAMSEPMCGCQLMSYRSSLLPDRASHGARRALPYKRT